jgi:hypothetical protein
MDRNIFKQAARNALITFAYVTLVGLFMSSATHIFGQKDTALTPVAVLMLLVFSASLVGTLVFGQPVTWYMDGKKKEALRLLASTIAALMIFMVLTFVSLLVLR